MKMKFDVKEGRLGRGGSLDSFNFILGNFAS